MAAERNLNLVFCLMVISDETFKPAKWNSAWGQILQILYTTCLHVLKIITNMATERNF
jgi:hypothetical protein